METKRVREAGGALADCNITVLSERDWALFSELLDNPHSPSKALMKATGDYKRRARDVGSRTYIEPREEKQPELDADGY